jgi:uncharacterized membrane protein YqhA
VLRRILASSRYVVLIAVVGTFVGALTLLVFEAIVIADVVMDLIREGSASPKDAKSLAVGLIQAVDVFLIAIAAYIISLSLYALFVDDTLPLPRWLQVHDLEDLKANVVSVVIAVLAVLFLAEAVGWDGTRDILGFGAALAFVIVALTVFLMSKKGKATD